MYLFGSFLDINGRTIAVHMLTGGDRTDTREIGADASLLFADSPVDITSGVNDTLDPLLCNGATVRLLTAEPLLEVFRADVYSAAVNIFRDSELLFAGYVTPQTYSQDYNSTLDLLEINCIDVLSALQYRRYKDIGSSSAKYAAAREAAKQRTFAEILREILGGATAGVDITGAIGVRYLYDGSKSPSARSTDKYKIFTNTAVSELLFLGDDNGSVWKQSEVLEEMLKYLGLHMLQQGLDFYIFDWRTIQGTAAVQWYDLIEETGTAMARNSIDISLDNVDGVDGSFSIEEVFNRVELTCEIVDVENVVRSPLDSESLTSPYTNKQKLLTELSVDGEGENAYNNFEWLVKQDDYEDVTYSLIKVYDWYVQVLENKEWTFPDYVNGTGDLIDHYAREGKMQHTVPQLLSCHPGAAILALGNVARHSSGEDNSPVNKLQMNNYLVVSVNGNGKDGEAETYPTEASLLASCPRAVYTGNVSGGVFSPGDDLTTNYIVISGTVGLAPLMDMTDNYATLRSRENWGDTWKYHTVPSRDNTDGRYYTRKYWEAERPNDTPVYDATPLGSFVPLTSNCPQLYEHKYSYVSNNVAVTGDKLSKVAALACMLIIGDKCVVETGTEGKPSDFVWRKFKERSECANDDEYFAQSFTIGFDPKMGDFLIGTEFPVQNNIDYTMGLDTQGMAIPIKKSDGVSGAVRFMILGPVNTVWADYTYRHSTWFRSAKYTQNARRLLTHTSAIYVKDFNVEVYSDNGLVNNFGNNDLLYISDTDESFDNVKDGLSFKISSALTVEERYSLGVNNAVALSSAVDTATGSGRTSIYDAVGKVTAKPEQLYVDAVYQALHLPRMVLSIGLRDGGNVIGPFHHYLHPAHPARPFFVQSISRDLRMASAELTLKEIL